MDNCLKPLQGAGRPYPMDSDDNLQFTERVQSGPVCKFAPLVSDESHLDEIAQGKTT